MDVQLTQQRCLPFDKAGAADFWWLVAVIKPKKAFSESVYVSLLMIK